MLQNYEALRRARKEEIIQGSMQGGVGETAASDLRREASGCKSLRSIKMQDKRPDPGSLKKKLENKRQSKIAVILMPDPARPELLK
jgi:hypothetical protein